MTHLATAAPYDVPKKSYLTGAQSEPSFVEWAIGCLHRIGALEDRAKANRWFMLRVDDVQRRIAMSALFPGENPWDAVQ